MGNLKLVLICHILLITGCSNVSVTNNNSATKSVASSPVRFQMHSIEEGLRSAYQAAVADINQDGRPDIILTTILDSEPAWYENPGWERHLFTDALESTALHIAFDSSQNKELPELFIAAGFSPVNEESLGKIYKLTSSHDPSTIWQHELVDTIFMAHRLYFADLNNDGNSELVVSPIMGSPTKPMAEYDDPTPLYYFHSGSMERHLINGDLKGTVHGMDIVDWDGKDGDDIVTSGFDGIWIHRATGMDDTGKMSFKSEQISKGKWSDVLSRQGASDAQVGKLPGGEKFIAAIEPFHGDLITIYTKTGNENSSGDWNRDLIDDSISHGHTIVTADLNNDGIDEVIASGDTTNAVYIYYATDPAAQNWRRETLDHNGAQSCSVADLNQDNSLDVICAGNKSKYLRWYMNTGEFIP